MPGDLKLVFHRLRKKGIPALLVGPAVRDALGNGTLDRVLRVDLLAVASGIQEIESVLDSASAAELFITRVERFKKALAFNVVKHDDGSLMRKLHVSCLGGEAEFEEELSRREVTVNAVAMTEQGKVFDPFDGMRDLAAHQIRPLQPPAQAFVQRPINLVKVAKHVAYHGFDVEPETEEHATRLSANILDVPPDRVRPEIERLLVNLFPDRGLDFLQITGVLKYLLPEVQCMVGFSDSCEVHHKDIWEHTKKVVCKSKPLPAVRWTALLHDIGKVWTRSVDEEGKVHFIRHEDLSANLFTGIAARFGLEERLTDRIRFLIQSHSRINLYTEEWSDSAVRRLMRETGDYLPDLLSFSKADITSRQERRQEELASLLERLEERIGKIREEDAKEPLLPKGAGAVIMKHFGLPEGPVIGQMKASLEEAIEQGRLPRGLPLEEYLGFLENMIRTQGRRQS
jgi:poly(A) polymerase